MAGTQAALMKSLLPPKRQQQLQPAPHPDDNNNTPKTPTQLALGIPEVLEHILSFVNVRDRQGIAQLVCKQWYFVCKRLAPVPFIWPLCLPDDENQTARGLVHLTDNLTIRVYQGKDTTQCLSSWTMMMGTLSDMIRERRQPKLRGLHLMEGVVVNFHVQLQELPLLTYLTTLQIDRENGWDIMILFAIFAACPNLEELLVKPTWKARYPAGNLSTILDPSHEERLVNGNQPPMARLRKCVLYNLLVTIPALKVFLESCPQLSELVLVKLYRFTRGGNTGIHVRDRRPIIDLVGTHCPNLKRLHLSVSDDHLSDRDVVSILEHFPAFEEYNFSDRDAGAALVKGLRTVTNRVTTLNLLPTQRSYSTRQVTLRDILCTFEHLLHLRAPNMNYFHEDMDVNDIRGRMSARWSFSYREGDHAMTDNPTGLYVWACRGLRTLHMTVGCRKSDSSSTYKSLIMFGFLSRMCPRLQELHLRRRLMDLSFKGGLCLLTRLQELERVKILPAYGCTLDEPALFWLRSTPSTMEHINHSLLRLKIKRDLRKSYNRLPKLATGSSAGRKNMIDHGNRLGMDFNIVGLPEDLLEWMSDRYGPRKLTTWPKLQLFTIEFSEPRQHYDFQKATAFVTKARPDAEFLFNHTSKDPYLTTLQMY
ncbi:hypothetical protein BGZ95_003676 [Linnemannia exigua]|uniref:F-box domain-containing protein n=1 Tax=Linnemannia exigua TaxID=604196 RepID=A0AAD4D3X3_9FUNG|nr:hypothetical protein BGZ95_003676 [Linnemannia exigua]